MNHTHWTLGWSVLALSVMVTPGAAALPGSDAAREAHPLRTADPGRPSGRAITATVGGVQLAGYLAEPSGKGPFPAVVMLHEWWGLNAQIKHQADTLAKEGFVVFAPDLYEGKVATDAETAEKYMNELDHAKALAAMKAAYQWVREQPISKGKKIGSVGWCLGGGHSLQLGLHAPIDAVVIYYGMVEKDPAVLKQLKGPLLGIFADRDGWIKPEMVKEFEAALKATPVKHEIHHYDADHAFANPSGPNYKSEMAADAWKKTLAFFKANLR